MDNIESMPTEKTITRRAESFDIPSILNLLVKNLGTNLSAEEKKEGFVTWRPPEEELVEIIKGTGVIVSVIGSKLKGYAITMSKEAGSKNPFFGEMLGYAEKMIYKGKPLSEYKSAIFAQICIEKEYRNGTTFAQLHSRTHEMLKDQGFEIFIAEVADSNQKSLNVHSMYTDVGTYNSANGEKWHVIVGDLRDE